MVAIAQGQPTSLLVPAQERVVTISDFHPAVVADSGVLGDRSSRVAKRLPTF